MTPNKSYGSKFGETVYISEVNVARKIKSDAQVAINNNQTPCRNFSLGVAGEDGSRNANFSKLLELSKMSRSKKLILGLQVNINKKANSRYPVDGSLYTGPKKSKINTQSLLYIFCEVKFKFNAISILVPVQWLSVDKHK